jgi:DNA-binding HxlR family transcriptional regulator
MPKGYDQECPIARALDIVGERWSLLVLRDLLRKGPLRFQDLERGLPSIAPNTLSSRLKALESEGVIGAALREAPAAVRVLPHRQGQGARPGAQGALRLGRAVWVSRDP